MGRTASLAQRKALTKVTMKEKAEEEKAEELQRVFPENLENWQNLGISQRHKLQITMKVGLSERDSHVTRVRHTLRHKFLRQDTSSM